MSFTGKTGSDEICCDYFIDYFRNKFVEEGQRALLHMDESRRSFITEFACRLRAFHRGELANQNGYNRLLCGFKGVGKSTLLDALTRATEELKCPHIVVCRHDYSECHDLPSQCILSEILKHGKKYNIAIPNIPADVSAEVGKNKAISEILDQLSGCDLRVLYVVDEISYAYQQQTA